MTAPFSITVKLDDRALVKALERLVSRAGQSVGWGERWRTPTSQAAALGFVPYPNLRTVSRDLPSRPGDYGRIDEASGYQIGGSHYLGHAHQPWDIIADWGLDFWEGSALAYLLRRKPGVDRAEDLRKAMHYLEKCVERAEAESSRQGHLNTDT